MAASDPTDPCVPEDEFPQHFVVMLPLDSGNHYVFCEAIASFNESKIEVGRAALQEVFKKYLNDRAQVAVLPPPGDPCAQWSYFSMKMQSGKTQGGTGGG